MQSAAPPPRSRHQRPGSRTASRRRPPVAPMRPAAVAGLALLLALATLGKPENHGQGSAAMSEAPVSLPTTQAERAGMPAGTVEESRPDATGTPTLLPAANADGSIALGELHYSREAEAAVLALRLAGMFAAQLSGGFVVQPFGLPLPVGSLELEEGASLTADQHE